MRLLISFGLAVLLSSCGAIDKWQGKNSGSSSQALGNGSIQGVVVNATTGERIALQSGDPNQGIYVLVREHRLVSSTHMSQETANDLELRDSTLAGEYFINGIPTDVEYVLVANVAGYEQFEAVFKINSTISQKTSGTEQGDHVLSYPTIIVDIPLSPKGTQAESVNLLALDQNDTKIEGVEYTIRPKSLNSHYGINPEQQVLSQTNGYVMPRSNGSLRVDTIHGYSDSEGNFKIPGSQLIPGLTYVANVTPPYVNQKLANNDQDTFEFTVLRRSKDFALANPDELAVANQKIVRIKTSKITENTDLDNQDPQQDDE